MKRALEAIVGETVPVKRVFKDGKTVKSAAEPILIEVVELPTEYASILRSTGNKYESLESIQQRIGCQITLANEIKRDGSRLMTFVGTRGTIDSAREIINGILAEHFTVPNSPTRTSEIITEIMMIPGNKCGLVIGKNGETIRLMQEKLGVKMLLVQESVAISTEKPLKISGDVEKVNHAKVMIGKLIHGEEFCCSTINSVHNYTIDMEIPRCAVGFVIGKKGENIRKLCQESGCYLSFAFEADTSAPSRKLSIQGTEKTVSLAKNMVLEIINRCQSNLEVKIGSFTVSAQDAAVIVENLEHIKSQTGTEIELVNDLVSSPERVFTIKGTQGQIDSAVTNMKAIIYERVFTIKGTQGQIDSAVTNMKAVIYGPTSAVASPESYSQNSQSVVNQFNDWNANAYYSSYMYSETSAFTSSQGSANYALEWAEYYRQNGMEAEALQVEQYIHLSSQNDQKNGYFYEDEHSDPFEPQKTEEYPPGCTPPRFISRKNV
uniref:K Homology domain-containing protein n=1 Tax=Panagrolaimus sp. JU765 TaxID=591449 RepID=A0AC34QV34_9BILA